MPLTEIQKEWLTKDVLYNNLRSLANGVNNQFVQFADKLEWLNLIAGADLTSISVPAETQAVLADFRTALNGLITEYNLNVALVIDQIRTL